MPRTYSLNEWIDSVSTINYDSGLTPWQYLLSLSPPEDPHPFRDYTIQHEIGAVSNSHLSRLNLVFADSAACGNLNRALERLVFNDAGVLGTKFTDAWGIARDMAGWLSNHWWVYGHQHSPNPVAEWYYTARPGVQNGLLDVQATSAGTSPYPTYCDATGL
jgi:hypothetical protein